MFNPHKNKTANGVLITVGMKVLDYDRRETTVVSDREDGKEWSCKDCNHTRDNDLTPVPVAAKDCATPCDHDHWFNTANGGMFNGSRLKAI